MQLDDWKLMIYKANCIEICKFASVDNKVSRSYKQLTRCPLSPYLFILFAETLSCKIREHDAMEGITLSNCEIKITQMVDDTTCFVKDKISLMNLIDVFKELEICYGLKINLDKTHAKTLGPEPEPWHKLFGLDWVIDPICTLGVTLSGNEDDRHIFKRLKTMKNLLATW